MINPVLTKTVERIKTTETPEIGNMVSIFGLHRDGAAYGIVTAILAHDEDGNAWDVKVTWFAPRITRKRARQENKNHAAARRVLAADTMDAVNVHYIPRPCHCHCGAPLDDGACECGDCAAEWNDWLTEAADVRSNLAA